MNVSLFDQAVQVVNDANQMLARVVTEQAISQVERNADEEWKRQARRAIEEVAHDLGFFTTDDVWLYLETLGIDAPHEPRALGAMIREATTKRVIVATGRYKKSSRVECHSRPVMIWEAR